MAFVRATFILTGLRNRPLGNLEDANSLAKKQAPDTVKKPGLLTGPSNESGCGREFFELFFKKHFLKKKIDHNFPQIFLPYDGRLGYGYDSF